MLATEIVGLVEIAVKMLGRKSELDKEYFEEFIQPIWEAFVKVHQDYKDSFKKYTDLGMVHNLVDTFWDLRKHIG